MFASVFAATLAMGAPALKGDSPAAGEWVMERFASSGEACRLAPRVSLGERSFGFDYQMPMERGNAVTWKAAFFRAAGERRADLVRAEWKWDDGVAEKAIWRVEGNRLTICIGPCGGPRPTDYSAPADSGRILIVLKRVSD